MCRLCLSAAIGLFVFGVQTCVTSGCFCFWCIDLCNICLFVSRLKFSSSTNNIKYFLPLKSHCHSTLFVLGQRSHSEAAGGVRERQRSAKDSISKVCVRLSGVRGFHDLGITLLRKVCVLCRQRCVSVINRCVFMFLPGWSIVPSQRRAVLLQHQLPDQPPAV